MGSAEMNLISLCPLSCLPAVGPYFKTSKGWACLRGVVFFWGYSENIQTHTPQSVTGKKYGMQTQAGYHLSQSQHHLLYAHPH